MTPQQQKAFSSWWLNEKYDGDLANVPGLAQNPNGNWVGEAGRIYDINPETGQKGQYQWMGTSAVSGWIDVTKPLYYTISNPDGSTFEVEMVRNRHGLYAPEEFLDSSGQRIRFNTNPNTGEEGEWIWLGTMGWTNIKGDPQPEPEPGTLVFGGGGQMVGPYDPDYDSNDPDYVPPSSLDSSSDETVATENPFEGASASGFSDEASGMSSVGMGFSAPMGLTYSSQEIQEPAQTSPNVDYVQELNNLLIADVVGNMLTGEKV